MMKSLFAALLSLPMIAGCVTSSDPQRPVGPSTELLTLDSRAAKWSFAVVSDIHVFPNARVAPRFTTLVKRLVELRPRFLVIDGDSTNGNDFDHHTLEEARSWWAALLGPDGLAPIRAAGIPIFPVAGNHDYYLNRNHDDPEALRKAYHEAWKDLAANAGPFALAGDPPLYYSVDVDGVHLSLMHVVRPSLEPAIADWLTQDLAQAASAQLRLVFGHVPLVTCVGKKINAKFVEDFGGLLVRGGVAAYIAGHEHLVWDEQFTVQGLPLRQVTVGTASATYNFPIRNERAYRAAKCKGASCRLPYTGQRFSLIPGTRRQADALVFAMVDILDGGGYRVRPMALDANGQIRDFR